MMHGYVKSETFAGFELHPGLRAMHNRIGLSASTSYLFVGYKTSLLRHMIDTAEDEISVSQGVDYEPTVQVRITDVVPKAHEHYADAVRGGALTVAGAHSTAVDKMNKILKGKPVIGYANSKFEEYKKTTDLARPGRIAYRRDHMMNGRLMVRLEARQGKHPDWKDTGRTEVSMLDIARLVHAE